jgi:glutamate racemase
MRSGIYTTLFADMSHDPNTSMDVIVASDLVDIVEQGIIDKEKRQTSLNPYIQKLKKTQADCLVL